MSHKIEIIETNKIIKVTYKGVMTLEERLSSVHELCCNFNAFKRFRLLIDVRSIKQEMTNVEQEIFGKYIATKEEFNMASVAVLDNIEKPTDQIVTKEAAEMGYQIKKFNSEKEALAWLENQT
ncbi:MULTISPECIES: hypothetical protein [unclassified Colwellia]|uniref:hypothetical protein n=1 Tax=unclassified Colwellia TaxID=196834 RepID=UPI0015F4E740|nr:MULTISPECIES: hypothetical protein [unclassified Colwellia]MBA6354193.1 hypothetical protein [Colwellia sp. BRX9-1]MBA6355667.1 hypothetical protein [Colwellia sp. BRX8-3]MBA6361464.1 hypothetical protein [Colwellia sp. BRX8-6]MBA6367182.1 hypothetical protein [Colwellia sp. BRX8-5]MBA6373505.1 hypothetical protein [Colwellia sp. BRX8-4]|tara:strand:+ start:3294 stop:3662 length:369 start_codon:yes stop_codon:yes gene_type:complete